MKDKLATTRPSFEAWFVSDHPNGYYELECQGCKHVAVYSDHIQDWCCRNCKGILTYPLGASW